MATEEGAHETKVSDRGGHEAGRHSSPSRYRYWRYTPLDRDEERHLSVEGVHRREGVFDDLEPVDVGETDAVDIEATFGAE